MSKQCEQQDWTWTLFPTLAYDRFSKQENLMGTANNISQ